jgi:hypothetical protein
MAQIALKVGDIKFLKRFSVPIKSFRFDYGLEQVATFNSTSLSEILIFYFNFYLFLYAFLFWLVFSF